MTGRATHASPGWATWAQTGDLAAIEAAVSDRSGQVERAVLETVAGAAARAGQVAVLDWVLARPEVQSPRWLSLGWVTAAVRAEQWALLQHCLAQELSPGAYPIVLGALIRAGAGAQVGPYLYRTKLVGQRGTLLVLVLRQPDLTFREAALDQLAVELNHPGGPLTWLLGLRRAIRALLTQGRTAQAQRVLTVLGERTGSAPVWQVVDAWLQGRSSRIRRRWLGQWPGRLPGILALERASDLAHRPSGQGPQRQRV